MFEWAGCLRVGAGSRMAFKVQRYACVLALNSLCFAWQVWLHQGVALRWGRSYALYSQGPCSNVANEGLLSCVGDANLLQSDAVLKEYLAFDSMRRACGVTNHVLYTAVQ